MFADDTMIYSLAETVQSLQNHLQSDVLNLHGSNVTN